MKRCHLANKLQINLTWILTRGITSRSTCSFSASV